MDEPIYLSPEEVGERFLTSKWTVRRWISAGKLPAVRVGRRWLIPADFVEALEREKTTPESRPADSKTYRIVRTPAPRYDFFERPGSESEYLRMANTVRYALNVGGWPRDSFSLKTSGIQAILSGREKAPIAFWRFLSAGIQALRIADPPRDSCADAAKKARK